jgi:hypothetical protein
MRSGMNVVFCGKIERNQYEARRRLEDNTKTDLKWNVVVFTGLIWLRIGNSEGVLWTQKWTFGFHRMLGNFWAAERLAASQEGLSCIEWGSYGYMSYMFWSVPKSQLLSCTYEHMIYLYKYVSVLQLQQQLSHLKKGRTQKLPNTSLERYRYTNLLVYGHIIVQQDSVGGIKVHNKMSLCVAAPSLN